jgi:hypothetical protein
MLVTGAPTDLDIARLRHEKVLDGLSTSTEPRRRRRKKAPVSGRNRGIRIPQVPDIGLEHPLRRTFAATARLAPIDPGPLGPEAVARFGEDNSKDPARAPRGAPGHAQAR